MKDNAIFSKTGSFRIGCNYWASHAGIRMWTNWRPEIIAHDFHQLAEGGLQVLRVFPLWPDFQPLQLLKGCLGDRRELRMGETPLGHDPLGRAGVSAEMMERFKFLADEAECNGLVLVVGLITGWMSGRLYVPPAFENLNIICDPLPVMWEIKFVKCFVDHFKDHPAIAAWDFGNECNCLAPVASREAAYLWAATISSAIREIDLAHPVISGMHGLQVSGTGPWFIEDQAENTDVLTTHPYPLFTSGCDQDPIDTLRNGLHATAESRLYADVGGRPCIVEEIGTLGPMICSEDVSANYARMSMLSAFAHDCRGFLWWCAYDQLHLEEAPYDWNAVERELGIFRGDHSPKPLAAIFKDFRKLTEALPELPPRDVEAVCILTKNQDNWAVAYSSFILAKQAGFDLEFQYTDQPLKKSNLYFLPSLGSDGALSRRRWLELLERVRNGAHLYISCNDAFLSPFNEPTGLNVLTREKRTAPVTFTLDCIKGITFTAASPYRLNLETSDAEVLGRETDGTPCFTAKRLGKGKLYFFTIPFELSLSREPGAFHKPGALPVWKMYEFIAREFIGGRVIGKDNPSVGVTEHRHTNGEKTIFLINYSPIAAKVGVVVKSGWNIKRGIHGVALVKPGTSGSINVTIPANEALVFVVTTASRQR